MIFLSKIILTNFRNFLSKKLAFEKKLVFLCGKNGIGKTNILEGLTIFSKQANLRSSSFDEIILDDKKLAKKANNFGAFLEILNHEFIENLGISYEEKTKKKIFKVNEEELNQKRQNDVKKSLINFIFLTPKIEQLFILSRTNRREYLDKIVCDIDFDHQKRVFEYQKLIKERLFILQKYKGEIESGNISKSSEIWLKIIEEKITETAVSIAYARIEAIDFFNKAIKSFSSSFPKCELKVFGEIEELVLQKKSVEVEEFYKEKLRQCRKLDLINFKTNFGVHKSDFDAIFLDKNSLATNCSTGEQKAIMIGIILARSKISAIYKNQPTILIFDEVISHLDEERKENLLNEVLKSDIQTFFSVTSENLLPKNILESDQVQIISML